MVGDGAPGAGATPRYTQVPVPEELVEAVNAHLLQLHFRAAGAATPWPVDLLVDLLLSAGPTEVQLVRTLARSTLAGTVVRAGEMAEQLSVTERELVGIVSDINDAGPPGILDLVVLTRIEHEGRVVREVRMLDEHAERVEQAVSIARRRRR